MKQTNTRLSWVALPALFAQCLLGESAAAPPRTTGAPGETSTCARCHAGGAVNSGSGSVKITLPGAATYTPGTAQRVRVEVADPAARRWGFSLSARFAADNSQAGVLESTDANAQVICDDGGFKPCAPGALEFITHTTSGTRNGTANGVAFEFLWRPPATANGKVTLFAAGNGANGDGRPTGDRIYTASLDLEPAGAAAPTRPAISATRGVVNLASGEPGVAPGAWLAINGTDLAAAARAWSSADFVNGRLPESLDGVSVTINGRAAGLQSISPTSLIVLAPDSLGAGPARIEVTRQGQKSEAIPVELKPALPGLFTLEQRLLAAHADGTLVGRFGNATPAQPGEIIVFYGTGFGPTDPEVAPVRVTETPARLASPLNITIGGLPARVAFAGLVPPFAHIYQFNVEVPTSSPDGDAPVVAEVLSQRSPAAPIAIQRR